MKKFSLGLLLSMAVFLFVFSGCATVNGLKEDTQNTWKNLQNADGWLKENWW